MKIKFFVLTILISSILFAQDKNKIDSNFHLYLLVGQSNMAGRAPVDSMSKVINAQIFMLDKNNNWVPATDPVHFDKPGVAGVGPGISFARNAVPQFVTAPW